MKKATDLLWMGCVNSRRACFTTAVYAILVSLAILAAAPILYIRYEDMFYKFIVFIYIGVLPFAGWIPLSLLLICGTIKGWTKLAFVWMLYTIMLIAISLLEIFYWCRTFMELLQQGSFRPDMLFIIGLLVVLTVINCFCIDIVSAYRRQKLKEMTNLSPDYAAYILNNILKINAVVEPCPDDPRLPEMRRLRPVVTSADKMRRKDGDLATSASGSSSRLSAMLAPPADKRTSSTQRISERRGSSLSVKSMSHRARLDSCNFDVEDEDDGEDRDALAPLHHSSSYRARTTLSQHIRHDRRYSIMRLDNGRIGLFEQQDDLAVFQARMGILPQPQAHGHNDRRHSKS